MTRIKWKWLLPAVQILLALAAHIYEPHQYRETARRDHAVNNLTYTFQHSPALVGRISRGINFPALVLSYPLRNRDNAIYQWNTEYTLIWISPSDLGFFVGIVILWLWVGWQLDRARETGRTPRDVTWIDFAGPSTGIVFSILTSIYAIGMLRAEWRPEQQIGAFGAVWSVLLLAYFTSRLLGRRKISVIQPT